MPDSIACIRVDCCVCGGSDSRSYASGRDFEYETVPDEFEFRQCLSCGHVYLDPRPAPETLPVIYPPSYYAYDLKESVSSLALRIKHRLESRKLAGLLQYGSAAKPRCLDIGCGDGRILDLLSNLGVPAENLEGTEIGDVIPRLLDRKGYKGHAGRIEDLDLQEGVYDFVTMFQVIEHVENPDRVLAKVARLLSPGGVFIVETPNIRSLDARIFKRRYWGGYHFPRHWNLFSRDTLRRIGQAVGLEEEKAETFVCAVFWIYPFHHFLREKHFPPSVYRFFWPLSNPALLAAATVVDLCLAPFGLTSNLRIVFRKPSAAA